MKLTQAVLFITLFALIGIVAQPPSDPEKFEIDPTGSMVGFEVSHLVISTIQGQFNRFSGHYHFDARNKSVSDVNFEIEASSLDTLDDRQNMVLKSPYFFNVQKHPKIQFKSQQVLFEGERPVQVVGMLDMNGYRRAVTLDVMSNSDETELAGEWNQSFQLMGQIRRTDFDLVWRHPLGERGLLIGDHVKIKVRIEAMRAPHVPGQRVAGTL